MNKIKLIAFKLSTLLLMALMVSGCATSISSSLSSSCGKPGNFKCPSLAEVYDAREAGALEHQQKDKKSKEGKKSSSKKSNKEIENNSKPVVSNIEPGNPLLSRPNVLRVWINRYESDGDLHDEQFVYLRLDQGHWLLIEDDKE